MIEVKVMDLIGKTALVKKILVKPNQKVKSFQSIMILDDNGQEMSVRSLFDGYINIIYVKVGDYVTHRTPVARLDINLPENKFMTDEFSETDLFFDFEAEIEKASPNKLTSKSKNKKPQPIAKPTITLEEEEEIEHVSNSRILKFKEEVMARITAKQKTNVKPEPEVSNSGSGQTLSFREMIMNTQSATSAKTRKDDVEVQTMVQHEPIPVQLAASVTSEIAQSEPTKSMQKTSKNYDILEDLISSIEPELTSHQDLATKIKYEPQVKLDYNFITCNTTIDLTEVTKLRNKVLNINQSFANFSYMAFMMKAISLSLEDFHHFNARYDTWTNELFVKRYHNIGVALQTAIGIKIPVIRLVEKLNINQIVDDIEQSMYRLRTNQTYEYDFTNRTIIITLLPVEEILKQTILFFTENVCVIAIGKINHQEQQHSMKMTVIFNSKVLHENEAQQFLEQIKTHLEKPYILSLNLV